MKQQQQEGQRLQRVHNCTQKKKSAWNMQLRERAGEWTFFYYSNVDRVEAVEKKEIEKSHDSQINHARSQIIKFQNENQSHCIMHQCFFFSLTRSLFYFSLENCSRFIGSGNDFDLNMCWFGRKKLKSWSELELENDWDFFIWEKIQ